MTTRQHAAIGAAMTAANAPPVRPSGGGDGGGGGGADGGAATTTRATASDRAISAATSASVWVVALASTVKRIVGTPVASTLCASSCTLSAGTPISAAIVLSRASPSIAAAAEVPVTEYR